MDRHIESVLQAERLEVVDRGWRFADECARLANQGAEVVTLLSAVFDTVQTPLVVYDGYGTVIAQYPAVVSWAMGISKKPRAGVLNIPRYFVRMPKRCELGGWWPVGPGMIFTPGRS